MPGPFEIPCQVDQFLYTSTNQTSLFNMFPLLVFSVRVASVTGFLSTSGKRDFECHVAEQRFINSLNTLKPSGMHDKLTFANATELCNINTTDFPYATFKLQTSCSCEMVFFCVPSTCSSHTMLMHTSGAIG